jgi:hypothetical protein
MRARKRNRMVFNPGEPEMYEHAQNTRFQTVVDDIQSDPTGRGRVPAASPLAMRPTSGQFDPEEGLSPELVQTLRSKESAGDRALQTAGISEGRNPQADFTPEEVDNRQGRMDRVRTGGHASPAGLLSGGKPWSKPAPQVPAWEQGDNEVVVPDYNIPPDPNASSAKPEVAPFDGGGMANMTAPQAPTKPDYGRVGAQKIDPASAGPAPAGGDKWLAAMRGVGSVLQSAGGRADQGMQSGLDAYHEYQDQERELREHGAKQAELDAATAKEQRGENRYASETNYVRGRDEASDFREAGRDAAQDQDRQFQRGFMERGEARENANTEYERGQGRQDALGDYEAKKRIDAKFAPKRGAGAGRAGQAERDMAYRSMMDSAKELYPDGVPTNVQNEIAMRAMDKDPIKASASFIDGIRGESTAQGKFETTRSDKQASASQKAEAAKAEASGALTELQALKADILAEKNEGKNYVPGKEPTAQNLWEGIPRVASRNIASIGGRGSSGFTPRQQRIQSGGKLVGRGKYLRNQGNSANLKAESDLADADILADGTLDGMLQRIDSEIQMLGGAIQSNQIVPRDANGNRLDLTEQAPGQAPGGQVFTNPEDM